MSAFDYNAYARDVLGGKIDTSQGLPDPVFNLLLKLSPMPNVDLLVRNEAGETLLAWRVSPWGEGWHIPGGIVRCNEFLSERIAAVARLELFGEVSHDEAPCHLMQFRNGVRGHFLSLLYRCRLTAAGPGHRPIGPKDTPRAGDISWFRGAPGQLYPAHRPYAPILEAPDFEGFGHAIVLPD